MYALLTIEDGLLKALPIPSKTERGAKITASRRGRTTLLIKDGDNYKVYKEKIGKKWKDFV